MHAHSRLPKYGGACDPPGPPIAPLSFTTKEGMTLQEAPLSFTAKEGMTLQEVVKSYYLNELIYQS